MRSLEYIYKKKEDKRNEKSRSKKREKVEI